MESLPNSEKEENIDTVEQLQNTEVNMEDIPSQNRSKIQKQSHGGIYSCDQCEFEGSRNALWHHKKSKHEGIMYSCDQCEYSATLQSYLRRHKKSLHEGVR